MRLWYGGGLRPPGVGAGMRKSELAGSLPVALAPLTGVPFCDDGGGVSTDGCTSTRRGEDGERTSGLEACAADAGEISVAMAGDGCTGDRRGIGMEGIRVQVRGYKCRRARGGG